MFNKDIQGLIAAIKNNIEKRILLLGVSYALLDFMDVMPKTNNSDIIIMETGGMKGTRPEMTKAELHESLQTGFNTPNIHSEYGMTEMMSQAYATENGIFHSPPWLQVRIFETTDPMQIVKKGKTGRLCIADLANLYSCSFLATDDLAREIPEKGGFELAGRLDFSDIRGCNLLWA
jgi:phenylacetate-coenzyme A ligase PaaK-like adenylate-forming protein